MELVTSTSCTECSTTKRITVVSREIAVKELRRAGWSVEIGRGGDRCPKCSQPAAEHTRHEAQPSDPDWSAAQIFPVLLAGDFTYEPGAAIWREGPDFCWEESMAKGEWVDGAELCVRVHYALGQAKRTSAWGGSMTAGDASSLAEGLRRLTRYLAAEGFDAKVDARGGERDHLIVFRLAAGDAAVVPLVQPA
jgi:hypothetical protein